MLFSKRPIDNYTGISIPFLLPVHKVSKIVCLNIEITIIYGRFINRKNKGYIYKNRGYKKKKSQDFQTPYKKTLFFLKYFPHKAI